MKNILIAPLNWGLGHATRCIPIINALIENEYNPIIASDGVALELLKKEFPKLQFELLTSYSIKYSKKAAFFKLKLVSQLPCIFSAYYHEKKQVNKLVEKYNLVGIISDNRLGVYSKKTKSVFITHQLTVLSGNTSWLTTKIHNYIIKKFDECWVPDFKNEPNLSGKLGHPKSILTNIKYIGPLSRLKKTTIPKKYKYLILLSGPEPQRTILEDFFKTALMNEKENILFIGGKIEAKQYSETKNSVTYYNFMDSKQLEKAFNESESVICRSGYTTIMDLAKIGKKAFFIPTPGQYEQEYLAIYLNEKKLAGFCTQDKIDLSKIKVDLKKYEGLFFNYDSLDFKFLFKLFQTE